MVYLHEAYSYEKEKPNPSFTALGCHFLTIKEEVVGNIEICLLRHIFLLFSHFLNGVLCLILV